MTIKGIFQKILNEGIEGGIKSSNLQPVGDGKAIKLDGEIRLTPKDKKLFADDIASEANDYYSKLSQLTETVIHALEVAGVEAVVGNEKWIGGFSGALSDEETARLKLDLIKDGKAVLNSILILNIQKDNSRKSPYELNTYLS